MLIYDCTNKRTFESIPNWLRSFEDLATSKPKIVLVANKTDLTNKKISTERGQSLAEEYGIKFFEASAKTGTNINEIFFDLADQIVSSDLHQT